MDYQDSACAKQGNAEGLGKGMQKQTVAARDHRTPSWAQKPHRKTQELLVVVLKKLKRILSESPRNTGSYFPICRHTSRCLLLLLIL